VAADVFDEPSSMLEHEYPSDDSAKSAPAPARAPSYGLAPLSPSAE
jgi:hypothetical protein